MSLFKGEAGIIKAKKGFVQKIKRLCKQNNALLIIDEVQSGAGRTGTLFAYEQFGVKPDIMCCAKGIGGGIPIGAILTLQKSQNACNLVPMDLPLEATHWPALLLNK